MRLMTKPWAIACISIASLTGVGAAIAQEVGQQGAPPAAKQLAGGGDVSLSPKDMLAKAGQIVPEMQQLRGAVGGQLTEAKKKKDVVKALCLDDKVKQM